MLTLKEYIILEDITSNDYIINEDLLTEDLINECADLLINEGLIDNIKNAISKVVSNPKEVIHDLIDKKSRSEVIRAAQKKFGKNIKNCLFPVDKVVVDDVMYELKQLNNEEDLKHIYQFTKNYIKKKDLGMSLVYWVIDKLDNSDNINKVCDDIRAEFGNDIPKERVAAIYDISSCIGQAILGKIAGATNKNLEKKKELNMSLTNQATS